VQLREAVDRAQGGIEFFAFEVWSKARANSDARARALEDASRLVGKIANPIKRDLIVGTLATAMDVDVGVVRNAMSRAGHPPREVRQQHPNAPRGSTSNPAELAPATTKPVAPPPTDEVELITLLADHPHLIATAEADKAFWLLTDERLRAMYSAARAGQSFLELAPVQLPPPTAKHVLSGKYAAAKDPPSSLAAMTRNLEARKVEVGLSELKVSLADAKRRGDHDLARRLAQLAEAERKGDRELVAKLTREVKPDKGGVPDPETSNRKQVE
jgi:hypothetical protein